MDIAIVGATGNVGRKTLEVLEKKELTIDNLYLVASSKSAGKKIKKEGIKRRLMGGNIEINKINLTKSLNIKDDKGYSMGDLRSACYSPHFKKVIGIAMIKEPYCKVSTTGVLEIDGNSLTVKVCDLPFI